MVRRFAGQVPLEIGTDHVLHRRADALFVPGAADVRAKSLSLVLPLPAHAIDPRVLATYAGSNQIPPGPLLTMSVEDNRLIVRALDQTALELQPLSDSGLVVVEALARLTFDGDGASKAASLKVLQDGRMRPHWRKHARWTTRRRARWRTRSTQVRAPHDRLEPPGAGACPRPPHESRARDRRDCG